MSNGAVVMVADDDRGIRRTVSEILRRHGFLVSEAADGDEAAKKLAFEPVDVVVLDAKMPRKDGISMLEDLAPEPPPPVVLLVSAYDIDADTRARLSSRVYRYMRKPVPPPELIDAVTEAAKKAKSAMRM